MAGQTFALRRDFDSADFLRTHWQRRPLLMRAAWQRWRNPLTPARLLALATRPGIESRLVRHARGQWRLEHGPLSRARLARLPARAWTVLVQAVDHAVPAVASLLDAFSFLPAWRMDDVMVSLAGDLGGVGPHFDHYDVFLVQGLGRRRWRIGQHCTPDTPLLPHDELRLLAAFAPRNECVLDPGDVLYLPPGIAHEGVALGGGCMTYSIGFRAPSAAELVGHWCDEVAARLDEGDRYRDPGLAPQRNCGEIAPQALARLRRLTLAALADEDAYADWFARHVSERRNPDLDTRPRRSLTSSALERRLRAGGRLVRHPASRYAFVREGAGCRLYVDGAAHRVPAGAMALAERLCARRDATVRLGDVREPAARDLVIALHDQGSLRFVRRPAHGR